VSTAVLRGVDLFFRVLRRGWGAFGPGGGVRDRARRGRPRSGRKVLDAGAAERRLVTAEKRLCGSVVMGLLAG
jgi:hypothetical protein